jgi:hypothetical protein
VEGKFLANCGEASDLSIGLAFESQWRRSTAKANPKKRWKALFYLCGRPAGFPQ